MNYFFSVGSPQHDMVPSPAVVTINSELQFLQKYLLPDSLANEILPKHGLVCDYYSYRLVNGQP